MKDDTFAFPHIKRPLGNNAVEVFTDGGMTLRDYFAAKAMQALITAVGEEGKVWYEEPSVSKSAYAVADAMLEARK